MVRKMQRHKELVDTALSVERVLMLIELTKTKCTAQVVEWLMLKMPVLLLHRFFAVQCLLF